MAGPAADRQHLKEEPGALARTPGSVRGDRSNPVPYRDRPEHVRVKPRRWGWTGVTSNPGLLPCLRGIRSALATTRKSRHARYRDAKQ